MKIDSGASSLFAQRAPAASPAARADGAASFATSLAGGVQKAGGVVVEMAGVKQADFTNMTRQEMRNWTNNQIRSGQMTLDEGFPFVAMTMKIPVGGGSGIPVAGDHERMDFMTRARQGIEGALSRNDPEAAMRLQVALNSMVKDQGQTPGVNIGA